ncbi:LytTR family DNA-binding domain-containing protein [Alistipes sp.]|uniref:LytTR family DNA-binding domain-containing protein n=1 Tax=Alistipes sp. TaxID=1872444 RepID=UPI0011DDA7BA|nr:LytTR family DNA-binding domain-containing protein [Alistipes sp.]
MMRYLVLFGYWMAAVLLLAAVCMSFDYGAGRSLFIATSMLPAVLCAQLFVPQALSAPRRRAVAVAGVCGGAVVVLWTSMLLASCCTQLVHPSSDFPPLFSNPIFLLILLVAFVVPGHLLMAWLRRRQPAERNVRFISERRRVTLPLEAIVRIESNDSEVLIHTAEGAVYRTRTRISQWERLLDERFVRIHRAWIVNADCVTELSPQGVTAGGVSLEFSRKYRDGALAALERRRAERK